MCHSKLTIKLQPQLNFIIGHNGSGKSAILTGLSIALGGKATATNRASSIKEFVKTGSDMAQVTVWIKNKGVDAFKHDVYGDSIIVERRINKDGGGSWKIKDSNGRTKSTKKDELVALCDHTNIQVDNPMMVLTQDASRQFLKGANPSEMYDFFLKGTQLQQLRDQYVALESTINSMKIRVGREEDAVPDLERRACEAADRYQLMKKQKDFVAKLEHLKLQLAWSQVVAYEKELERNDARSKQLKSKVDKLESDIQRLVSEREAINDKITDLEKRSQDEGNRIAPLNKERAELKQSIQKLKAELVAVRSKESSANKQYTTLSRQLEDLQQKIDDEAAKLAQDNQEKHDRLEARRHDIEERRRQCETQEAELRDELRNYDPQMRDIYASEARCIEARDRLRHEVQETEVSVHRLAATSKNSLEAYGSGVAELIRAINQEGRWHRKPVGPIGQYLKVKDAKWVPVLESVIGNTLNAFCVVDHHDRRILEQLKQRLRCNQISILTSSDEAFDFSAGEPPADVVTILRVLDIKDDYILRQLVNAVHIESSALVERRPDGDQLMRRSIRNVKYCFSADMFRLGGGAVGSSTQTLNKYKGPPRLSSDLQGRLAEARAALERAQQGLAAANEKLRETQASKRQLEEAAKANRQKLSVVGKQLLRIKDEIVQLDDEVREGEPANVAAIEAARRDTREELDRCRETFEQVQGEKEEIEAKMRPLVDRSEELKQQMANQADEVGAIKIEISTVVRQRVQNQQTEVIRKQSLAKSEAELAAIEEEIETNKLDVESATSQAMIYTEGVRVEATRSMSHYEREIQAVERLIKKSEQEGGGSLKEVGKEYNDATRAYNDAKRNVEQTQALIKAMRSALNARVTMWRNFRHHIALAAKSSFSAHLANRGYTGKLTFQHEDSRLVVNVQTDSGGSGQQRTQATQKATGGKADKVKRKQGKDTGTLSGGETSFSTICLLLALWQAIGCPIRCLDEFDVFMDPVNRRMAMSMIVDATKKSPGIQYVLITPQDITNTKFGPEVNMQKLKDPERGQTTLELGPAA